MCLVSSLPVAFCSKGCSGLGGAAEFRNQVLGLAVFQL